MKEKIRRFMMGRYGVDSYGRFLLVLALILMLISRFYLRYVLYITSMIVLIYLYFRMFSKNISKRYKENQFYLSLKNKVVKYLRKQKYMIGQRRIYHIYSCPSCRQKIRIPRGKGKICIRCPKCKHEFIKRS